MNTAKGVASMIEEWKAEGLSKTALAWNIALACVGWPYVFGAWGAECTVSERKKRYKESHPTIKTACKAYDGGACTGCKWFPDGERVRCFDCRGFTDWVLKQAGAVDLVGEGATGQWNTASNWTAKGEISTMPSDKLCCLFVHKDGKMQHTGFGYNSETVECSSGVQHFKTRNKKWTHWATPVGLEGDAPIHGPAPGPEPEPSPVWRKTLRKGDRGEEVRELQTMLHKLGYNVGIKTGIDGIFGKCTQAAVMEFQGDHIADFHLVVDGICGPMTWDALEKVSANPPKNDEGSVKTYIVKIYGLDLTQANALAANYPGAEVVEGSDGK